MARRKTTTHIEQQEPEELDAFERALLEFRHITGVKLDILRYDRDEGRGKYLKRVDYDPNVMSFEWIRKKWGAGTYQLRFRDAEDPSRGWSQVVDIAADENTEQRSSLPTGLEMSSPLLSMLQRQNEIMLTALVQNRAGGGGGSESPALVKLIEGINANQAAMLSATLNRGDSTGSILSVFEKGLELAKDAKLESEGGWIAQIGRIARDLLPALQELNRIRPMTVIPSSPAAARATAPALPSSTAQPPAESDSFTRPAAAVETAKNFDRGQLLEDSLRQFAPQLLDAIEQGAPPEDVADQIIDSIPPMFYPELEAVTTDRLLGFEQRLKPHRSYVDRLVKRVHESTGEDEHGEGTADQNNTPPAG